MIPSLFSDPCSYQSHSLSIADKLRQIHTSMIVYRIIYKFSNISQKEKGVFTPFMVDSLWLCRLEPSLAAVGGTMLFGSVLLWAPQPGPLHLSAGQIPSGYSPPSHRPTAIPALPSLPSKQKLFVSFYPSFPWF